MRLEDNHRLFEDFLDDVPEEEIASDETKADLEDEASNKPVQSYPHYVQWQVTPVHREKNMDMLSAGISMLKNRLFPMMRYADRDIVDWKPCFYASGYKVDDTGAWSIDDAYEYFTYIYKCGQNNGLFRIYFEPKDNITVRGMLRILYTFCQMTQVFRTFNTTLNMSSTSFTADGFFTPEYDMRADAASISTRCFVDKKSRLRARAWVKLFDDSKKALKELDQIISAPDNFMDTNKSYRNLEGNFIDGMKDCQLSPYRDHTVLCVVPFGKTATVKSGNDYFTECVYRIDGTLVMEHNMSYDDYYRTNSDWDVWKLDENYEHVTLQCRCNFDEWLDGRNTTTIDMFGRHVRELVISCSELVSPGINELKAAVTLKNAENVGDIRYVIEDYKDYKSE